MNSVEWYGSFFSLKSQHKHDFGKRQHSASDQQFQAYCGWLPAQVKSENM